jgi:hypothetical protein
MEKTEQVQVYQNCNQSLQVFNSSLTIYKDGILKASVFTESIALLKKAFPKLTKGWYEILRDRAKDKGFTNERFKAAVLNCIDTCKYPEPTVAMILDYDQRIEMLTWYEVAEKEKSFGKSIWDYYETVDIKEICYYARKEDVIKYQLKKFIPKERTLIEKEKDSEIKLATKEVLHDIFKEVIDKMNVKK